MPQMSPMNWTFIFILVTVFILMSVSNLDPVINKSMNKQNISKKENSMKW